MDWTELYHAKVGRAAALLPETIETDTNMHESSVGHLSE